MSDFKQLNGYSVKDEYARNEIAQMKINFQGGVDTIYNAIVAQGVTPSSSTPSDCAAAITSIGSTQYNIGRSQGRKDVGANPIARVSSQPSLAVTSGHYYIIEVAGNYGSSYQVPIITGGCTILASSTRRDLRTGTGVFTACQVHFVKATSNVITFDRDATNTRVIELGLYQ